MSSDEINVRTGREVARGKTPRVASAIMKENENMWKRIKGGVNVSMLKYFKVNCHCELVQKLNLIE